MSNGSQSNGSLSHTKVTQVEIGSDGTIQVSIEVDAFMPGESVEISGYIAQNHGAFATINDFQTIQGKLGGIANLTVSATPTATSDTFQRGQDVMVLLRTAKVWFTVLAEGPAQGSGIPYQYAGPGTVWGKFKGAAGSDSYSDTLEGDQSGSGAGDAAQATTDGSSG